MGLLKKIFPFASTDTPLQGAGDALPAHQKTFFEAITKGVPDALVLADTDRKILMCNPAVTEIFGYEESELLGLKVEVLYESQEEFKRQGKLHYHLNAEEKSLPYIVNYKRKNGETFPGETIGSLIKDRIGNTLGYLGVIRDVTERTKTEAALKESEARLKSIIDTVPVMITVKDMASRYQLTNKHHKEFFGFSDEDLKGKTPSVYSTEHGEKTKALEQEVIKTGKVMPYYDYSLTNIDGKPCDLMVIKAPLRDLTGDISGTVTVGIDISDRKKAEAALQESQENFLAAIDNMAESFALFDADDKLIQCNQKYLDAFAPELVGKIIPGTSFEELVRIAVQHGFYSVDGLTKEEAIQRRLEKHRNPQGEFEIDRPDGRCFSFNESKIPGGGTVLLRRDVTERKQIERELRKARDELEQRVEERTRELKESETRLRTVVDSSPAGMTLKDPAGPFIIVNSIFSKWMGADPSDIEGKTAQDFFPQDQADEVEALDRKVFETGEALIAESLLPFRDGVSRTVLIHKSPVFSDTGKVIAISTVLTDITERKIAEEGLKRRSEDLSNKVKEHLRAEEALRLSEGRLRNIMENIVEGVITIDSAGIIESFNPAAEKIFGYTAAEVLGENISILTDEPYRSEHDRYPQNYHETGNARIISTGFRDVRGRRKDNTTFPAELAVSEMEYGSRKVFIGTIRDISERKESEKALMAAKERAEFANRTKTEFLAHMSHELRTPLNAILGYSDILKGELFGPLGNEKYPEYVENISQAGGLLLDLLSDILDVSKVEAGELEIEEEAVDIAAVFKECRVMVLERADMARLGLSMKVEDDLPKLLADRRRLKQILLNLLINAIKFTPKKGKIVVNAALGRDGAVSLRVSDTGIGIAPENIQKILQPFGQVTDAYVINNPGEGMGLGLSLVNALVELHGGRLDIDSAPGEGTRVSVTFPPERTLISR